ncbi:26S proteasome regulatory complex, non-ATPase subcomplex, Rpn1 subunit [Rozella allomycis CSF55]|uniref:26S proteasome regulatory subunit RPN1 n=1 Tax=Rozella allomycis (strain CSF55) TaxID=988480 RepID=A0A4P9YSX1_ROZAC|nr:26S proteasome regulatory complex, non-ATPase subcomplex, Rpn1 subunit [Rozella allomycis CSF55]
MAKEKKQVEEELNEEDMNLKQELEHLVERLGDKNEEHQRQALEGLKNSIRTATTSMTSVPKPLKFLRPHFKDMEAKYKGYKEGENKRRFAEIMSVLAMTFAEEGKNLVLYYYMMGGRDGIEGWGHDYMRHLAMEIKDEYNMRFEREESVEELRGIGIRLVPFFLSHNAESDACDLLIEIEGINKMKEYVDENTYERVCMYLQKCVSYMPYPEDVEILKIVHEIYRRFKRFPEALGVALKLNDVEMIKRDFEECEDRMMKKQLGYILSRQQVGLTVEDEEIQNIMNNNNLSEHFLNLAKELQISEAKLPEEIYKSHLENFNTQGLDSAKQNLASTIVNGFVNCCFCVDKLMMNEQQEWIYKNKNDGMMSASASIGMIMMWEVENGLSKIDKYLYSNDEFIKAGAILGIGLMNVRVKNESDPALALLSEYLDNESELIRISSIIGLGFSYAGTGREDVYKLLIPFVSDSSLNIKIVSFAVLALGLIFVGTCHGELTSTILQTIMERNENDFKSTFCRFLGLGLGLIFLNKQEMVETILETLKVIEHPFGNHARIITESLAYAGTGNVLKVQEMLKLVTRREGDEGKEGLEVEGKVEGVEATGKTYKSQLFVEGKIFKSQLFVEGKEGQMEQDNKDSVNDKESKIDFATLAISIIAMGEEIGSEMSLRIFSHLMHYGEPNVRKIVPLAISLLCASNPKNNILDTLSKYSHDSDLNVAYNSIFALGIVAAGTNNARVAQMLRQLASYYNKDSEALFIVRIAQGLVHMGKGTLSLNPFHLDRSLMAPVSVAGLLITLFSFTDSKNIISSNSHYLLYSLALSIYPRFLITLDENNNLKPITVRVAGKPKTITGFQTHTTPVLLAHTERAELATEEFISLSHVLEGFVIIKKNPNFIQDEEMNK